MLMQHICKITIDGIFGAKTKDAVKAWQAMHNLTADGIIGQQTLSRVKDQLPKLSSVNFDALNDTLSVIFARQSAIDGAKYLVKMCIKHDLSITEAAYVLATAKHETAHTMMPIEEYGHRVNYDYGKWRTNNKGQRYCYTSGKRDKAYLESQHPHLYYGRGYVQITWLDNYERLGKVIGRDIVTNPHVMITDREASADVMIVGMVKGLFTGKSLKSYISDTHADYNGARAIINPKDYKTYAPIASTAYQFEAALRKAIPVD